MHGSLMRAALRASTSRPILRPQTRATSLHAFRAMTSASKPARASEATDYAATTITEDHSNMPGPEGPDGDAKMRYFTG